MEIIRQNQKKWWQSGVVKAKNQGQPRLEDLQRCKGISCDQSRSRKNGAAKEGCGERLSTVGSIPRDCQGCGEHQGGTSILFKCQCGKMVCIATRMPLTVTQACKVPALVPFYSAGPSSQVVSDKHVLHSVTYRQDSSNKNRCNIRRVTNNARREICWEIGSPIPVGYAEALEG